MKKIKIIVIFLIIVILTIFTYWQNQKDNDIQTVEVQADESNIDREDEEVKEDININSYINKNLIYNQKEKINSLMNEYISKYLYDEYDKENNKNGPTK